jgi:hypothetical protein
MLRAVRECRGHTCADPGPGILYVLGRTLHGGRGEGVLSALVTFVGGSVHVLAAELGLSAILMTSARSAAVRNRCLGVDHGPVPLEHANSSFK